MRAWGATTCWPSGLAKATPRPRWPGAGRQWIRSSAARRFTRTTWGCRRCARRWPIPWVACTARWGPSGSRWPGGGGGGVGRWDEVLAVTPVWPNLTAQPVIMGAVLRCLPLRPQPGGAWVLDVDALLAAITPATRLLVLNAPNNPTGWTLSAAEQRAILARCRQTGCWILADEVYERLYYEPSANGCAPSFLDLAQPED